MYEVNKPELLPTHLDLHYNNRATRNGSWQSAASWVKKVRCKKLRFSDRRNHECSKFQFCH